MDEEFLSTGRFLIDSSGAGFARIIPISLPGRDFVGRFEPFASDETYRRI
jgi:hypothetical protein